MKVKKQRDIRMVDTDIEVRSQEDQAQVLVGYALKFDKPSTNLWQFTEVIKRGALDNTDMSGTVALLNHDYDHVLGRVGKNLTLEVDDIGLRFSLELNKTSYAMDLVENIRSGLISKCSFGFTIPQGSDEWQEQEDGTYLRNVNRIDRLYDVSIVTVPAYDDTEVVLSQRSVDAFERVNGDLDRQKKLLDFEVKYL